MIEAKWEPCYDKCRSCGMEGYGNPYFFKVLVGTPDEAKLFNPLWLCAQCGVQLGVCLVRDQLLAAKEKAA